MIEDYLNGDLKGQPLFHFTDYRNLPSIKKLGLLSYRQSQANGVLIPAPGGNDISINSAKACGLDDYVSLSMTANHPMEFVATRDRRIKDAKYISVKNTILLQPGVMGCLGMSNKKDAVIIPILQALEQMDLEVLYRYTDWKAQAVKDRKQLVRKYEILVPQRVALEFLSFP